MAILQRVNWLSNQRVDLPDLKNIESFIGDDLNQIFKKFINNTSIPYVISGFEIFQNDTCTQSELSNSPIFCQLEDSTLLNTEKDQDSVFYVGPIADKATKGNVGYKPTTEKIELTSNSINYIEIDLSQYTGTPDTRSYWSVDDSIEFNQITDTVDYLQAKIFVNTSGFTGGTKMPVAKIKTDASNNIQEVLDARNMFFRLGTGTPYAPENDFTWGTPITGSENTERDEPGQDQKIDKDTFRMADKHIKSFKEWMDAMMSVHRETTGLPYWFSSSSGINLLNLFADLANTRLTGKGKFFHNATTAGLITWNRDFFLKVIGSRIKYRVKSNLNTNYTQLNDGQVAYIKLERDKEITPLLIFTNGSDQVTSYGAVAWANSLLPGDFVKLSSDKIDKYYEIKTVAGDFKSVTLTENFTGTSTGASGRKAQYTLGSYETVATPSTARHIRIADRDKVPFDGNVYWLFFRDDNTDSTAKVYLRNGGNGDLEQGESIAISEDATDQTIKYIGASSDTDDDPNYSGAVGTKEVTQVDFIDPKDINTGLYFNLDAADGSKYYVWFKKAGAGTDPTPAGRTAIMIDILSTDDTDVKVAQKAQAAINAVADFSSPATTTNSILITDANNGTPASASKINVNDPWEIFVPTEGDISTKFNQQNYNTIEGENLTRRAARLTSMVADKAQDKTVGFLEDYKLCKNTTSGTNQLLVFANSEPSANNLAVYYRGSLDTSGSITQLNNANPKDYWVVTVAGTMMGKTLAIGDYLVCTTAVATPATPADDGKFVKDAASARTPYLHIGMPSSANSGYVNLDIGQPKNLAGANVGNSGVITLAVNQVAFFRVNRDAAFNLSLDNIIIDSIASCPLEENVFILAYRLSTTEVWLWNGNELNVGDNISFSAMNEMFQKNVYEEELRVVFDKTSTVAIEKTNEVETKLQTPDNKLPSGTLLTLPNDSRYGENPRGYIVGKGILEIDLNGQTWFLGKDFEEVGGVGDESFTFKTLHELALGDILKIRIDAMGGYIGVGTAGVGENNTGANVGTGKQVFKDKTSANLNFRTLKEGNNITIAQNTDELVITAAGGDTKGVKDTSVDYVITNDDGFGVIFVVTGSISDKTITLPTAVNNKGRVISVKKVDSGSNYVKVTAAEAIDDQSPGNYNQAVNEIRPAYDSFTYVSNGVQWFVI